MATYRVESERRAEVSRWQASGQSVASYCAAHGISSGSLHRWRKEFEGGPSVAVPRFLRVEVVRRPAQASLTLEIGPARVRVEPGFDAALLREVVTVLAGGRT